MKPSDRSLIIGTAIAFFLTLTLAAFAREQPAPVSPPAEAAPAGAPAAAKAPPAQEPAAPAKPGVASDFAAGVIAGFSDAGDGEKKPAKLRRLDEPAPQAPDGAQTAESEKSTIRRIDEPDAAEDAPAAQPGKSGSDVIKVRRALRKGHNPDDYVRVGEDIHIAAGDRIEGDIVGIMGDVVVDGEALRGTSAVMGDVTINGIAHGDVSSVLGDVTLGPGAVVEGNVTTFSGEVHRDPGAIVHGRISRQNLGKKIHAPDAIQGWWDHALGHGALLGVGRGLGWLATLTFAALVFYVLLGLIFPGGVRRTGDMLVQRPVAVALSALLTMLALPVLFLLLCITVIGIPVAFLGLPVAIFLGVTFGQAAIYGLIGRTATRDRVAIPVSVLIGGLIFVLLYHAPIVGLALALLTAALGLGCSVTAVLTAGKKPATPTMPVVPLAPPPVVAAAAAAVNLVSLGAPVDGVAAEPAPAQSAGFGTAEPVPPVMPSAPAASAPPPLAPVAPNATLPRAGFWIRAGAILIDLVLVGMICGPTGAGALILPALAAYGAVMWKFKGTTIGGIVCGLKVVRLDDRPLDWPTTVVRALGCFLSLAVAGLGFVWVVFDSERQSWHDKIAGTVVVRAPKGTSLV